MNYNHIKYIQRFDTVNEERQTIKNYQQEDHYNNNYSKKKSNIKSPKTHNNNIPIKRVQT